MSEKTFQLVVRKGPKVGQIFPLISPTISIGRDPTADIAISDPEVSRYHAQLVQTETGYQIQDMGSTNGTYIGGNRLGSDPVQLSPGDSIQLGSSVVVDFKPSAAADPMATMVDSSRDLLADIDSTEAQAPEAAPPLPEFEAPFTPEPAYEPPPPPPATPLVMPGSGDTGKRSNRRTVMIVAVLLLVCCCCAFFVSGYYWWGDLLLQYLRDLGFATF